MTQVADSKAIVTQPQNSLDVMRQAQKQALSGGAKSYILRPKDGESIRLRILKEMTEGTVVRMHRLPEVPYKAMCGTELGMPCEYCRRAKAGEWKLQASPFMYLPCAVVIEDETGKKTIGIRFLELYAGKNTIYAKLERFYDDNHTVLSWDFSYSRKGSKKEDTTYDFTPQLNGSVFKPDVLARSSALATPESIRNRVAEAFPPGIIGSGDDTNVVESSVVSDEGSADDIPAF